MIRVPRFRAHLLSIVVCLGGIGCQVRMLRPKTTPSRMIEPQVLEPQPQDPPTQVTKTPDATPLRLFGTEASEDIGRKVLHKQANGELTEDAVWRWSSAPDQYLDTALRLEASSRPDVRLVDTSRALVLAPKLLVWDLESAGEMRLVGVVEFQVTGEDRVVHTQVVRTSEPVSAELPGNLAVAAGRMLRRLASEGLACVDKATKTEGKAD